MRETSQATAFGLLRHHPSYIERRNKLILKAWRDEGRTWAEVAEQVGMSVRQCQRAATAANGGVYPKERFKWE